jgi:hypothetical protein
LSTAAATFPRRGQSFGGSAAIPAIPGGWIPVPRRYLERVSPALSKVERAIVDLVLLRTIGDEGHGRPEWATITEAEYARYAGATVDGVHRALERLTRMHVLELAPAGRSKKYRFPLDNTPDVPAPVPRKLQRKPPRSEGLEPPPCTPIGPDAVERSAPGCQSPKEQQHDLKAADGDPELPETVLPPNGRPVPIALPPGASVVRFSNHTASALSIAATQAGSAVEISISAAWPNGAAPLPASDICETRAFLHDFLPLLHCGPREKDVAELAAARAGKVSIAQLRAYVERRLAAGLRITSYGIFAKLAHDCIDSADSWNAAHAPPPAREAFDYRAQLLAWAARLDRASPAFEEIAAELRSLVEAGAADAERLDQRLPELQTFAAAIARTLLSDRVPELRQRAIAENAHYRQKMTRDQFAALEQQSLERLLLEELDLPRLSPANL